MLLLKATHDETVGTLQNIDSWYTLEPPRQGCSYEYQHSMLRIIKGK